MIIANRSLHLQQDGRDVEVPVRVFAPQPDGNAWSCTYEIGWPGETRRSSCVGSDSMQALMLALHMIGTEIYTSDFHKSGVLNWDNSKDSKSWKGYGFPVPVTLRDLLVGDDAKFF
jgi:hypothetical protein